MHLIKRLPAGRARLLLTGALLAWLLAGCAGNARSGGDDGRKLSPSAQATLQLEQSVGFVDDPKLQAYVEEVGRRIAAQGKRHDVDFRFYILDMPVPNALALPEGQVFVSRGVLILVNSEDELAGILAHEIAHVEEHHSDQRQGLNVVTSPIRIGTGIAGWATGLIIPDLGDAITELGESTTGLVLAPYSREQEREADLAGQSLVAAAGYQPEGLVSLLETMSRAEKLDPENTHEQSFFDTHPATAERVALTREHGKTLVPAPRPASARDRKGLLEALHGLVIGEDPAKGFFVDNWFVHPGLAFAMGFPREWTGINTDGFVGAQLPNEDTFVMLALVAEGTDPIAGARAASKKLKTDVVSEATRGSINGLPAARTRTQITDANGVVEKLELTWIAYGGLVYQIMGVAAQARFDAVEELMTQSANSFRPLSDEERSQIKVAQLETAEAGQGESFAALAERVKSPWSAEAIAVVNGKPVDAKLAAGELIKVGILERYAWKPRHPPAVPVDQPAVSRRSP